MFGAIALSHQKITFGMLKRFDEEFKFLVNEIYDNTRIMEESILNIEYDSFI